MGSKEGELLGRGHAKLRVSQLEGEQNIASRGKSMCVTSERITMLVLWGTLK